MVPVIKLSNEKLSRIAGWYVHFLSRLSSGLLKLSIAIATMLFIIVFWRVLSRYLFGSVPIWSGEVSSYLAIWMTWVLIGVLIHKDDHLQVSIGYQRLPFKIRYWLRLTQLILIVFLGFEFTYQGYLYAITAGRRSTFVTLSLDMFWAYLILPLAGIMMMIFSIGKILEIMLDPNTIESDSDRRISEEKRGI